MQFGHHFWGMHLFWWLFWTLVVAALLLWPRGSQRDSALEVLRRRYASGQITEDEYRHRLETLERAGTHDHSGARAS